MNNDGDVCSTISCQYGPRKPKASWIHRWNGQWVCYPCAQRLNAEAARNKMMPPCISSREHMLQVLMK